MLIQIITNIFKFLTKFLNKKINNLNIKKFKGNIKDNKIMSKSKITILMKKKEEERQMILKREDPYNLQNEITNLKSNQMKVI